MKITTCLMVICTMLAVSPLAMSQTQPTTQDEWRPVQLQLIPPGPYPVGSFEDVLKWMQDRIPELRFSIIRAAGTSTDYPKIQELNLKDVTVDQFFQVVKRAFPGVTVEQIQGYDASLYLIRIVDPAAAAQDREVSVYRLYEAIVGVREEGDMGTLEARNKKALNDLLSLVEAALKQAGLANKVVLQVHEPTQALVVAGPVAAQDVVKKVMAAIAPSDPQLTSKLRTMDQVVTEFNARYSDQVQRDATEFNEKYAKKVAELNALQLELQTLRKQLQPTTSANAPSTTRPKE